VRLFNAIVNQPVRERERESERDKGILARRGFPGRVKVNSHIGVVAGAEIPVTE
jgi:hypothetical protein